MTKKITRRKFIQTSSLTATGIILGCSVHNQFNTIIKNGLIVE